MRTIAPDLRISPPRLAPGVLAAVILIHAGMVAAILARPGTPPPAAPAAPLYVRLIEPAVMPAVPAPTPAQPEPKIRSAPPVPPRPAPEVVRKPERPQPVESARPDIPHPEPPPAPAPVAIETPKPVPPPPLPVTQPRFNADYLDNPKPPYPGTSRRMGEEGEVRLRVHVTPAGTAQQVEVYRSSGFPRLDQAALDAVKQWRFIPARQGDQPVPAWVIVPIQFSLRS